MQLYLARGEIASAPVGAARMRDACVDEISGQEYERDMMTGLENEPGSTCVFSSTTECSHSRFRSRARRIVGATCVVRTGLAIVRPWRMLGNETRRPRWRSSGALPPCSSSFLLLDVWMTPGLRPRQGPRDPTRDCDCRALRPRLAWLPMSREAVNIIAV